MLLCPHCGQKLVRILEDGDIQIRHQGRWWRFRAATIRCNCPNCGRTVTLTMSEQELCLVKAGYSGRESEE